MHFDRLARNWENLAKQDPMWAILTDDTKKGGAWDHEAFFLTGRETIAWLGSWLSLHRFLVPRGRALDFGCGLGRLTQALAPHFDHVTGVDISASMVRGAMQHNRFGDKVRYLHNQHPDLRAIETGSLAFVLSAIVLQHMRTAYQQAYVREFVRVLQPGGLLFFQAPVAVIRASCGRWRARPGPSRWCRRERGRLPGSAGQGQVWGVRDVDVLAETLSPL